MKKFTTLLVLFLFTYASKAQYLECPRFLNPDEPQPTKTIANREGVAVAPSKEMYVFNVKIHYIKRPVDPTTGNSFNQAGDYDSPFYEHWNNAIVDIAYMKYLQETNQTN